MPIIDRRGHLVDGSEPAAVAEPNPGIAIKTPCRAATTANIALSGLQAIDGVVLAAGDRVLVKHQTSAIDNGIYNAASGNWPRAVDWDGNNEVVRGTQVMITSGTVNALKTFAITAADPLTIGTSAVTITELAPGPELAVIAGITTTGLLARTGTTAWSTRTLSAPAAGITIANPAGIAGDPTFALANDLAALEALASTGFAARTATDTWAQRTLTAPAAGFSITNPAGIAGNPTFVLANDLAALEGLGSTGIAVRTASDAWVQRTLVAPAAGITITNPAGIAGDITVALANDLAALEGLSSTGLIVRTGDGSATTRAVTGTANEITATNGDGVSGAPTLSLPATLTFTGKTVTGGTFASPTAITGLPDPSGAQDAATKAYVDTVAAGLDVKASVKCATTANIALSGEQTLDGVLTAAARVLVKNQSAPAENGIYVSAAGAWTRATDMDAWTEVPGAFVFIEQGTLYADTGWVSSANAGGTLGATAITWSQFAGTGSYTAGTGLTLTGTQFSLTNPVTIGLGGTGQATATAGFDALSPTTTRGDIITRGASNNVRLAVGAANRVLRSDGTDPSWAQVALATDVSGDLPFANLTQGSALSVLGVTGNATADHASIAAGSDHQVLRRSGTAVGFGAVNLAQADAVTGALAIGNGGTGDTGTAWTAYTPSIAADVGAFTTVAAAGRYKTIGKTVFITVSVDITTAGTAASTLRLGLPAGHTAASSFVFAAIEDQSLAVGGYFARLASGATTVAVLTTAGATPIADARTIRFSGVYEIA